MPIDFRNPLTTQGALLERLRTLIGRAGSPADNSAPVNGKANARHTDRVSLSSDAQRIADELRGSEATAHYDAERVATLKQAIETGTFRIDTARIAHKVSLQYGDR
ncbi:MAG TPA: flagellar biosynthesis anti-sigma factor FlgM [Gammaproteobacteria bacterium]|nr:flagellar biosynthesis anti-sigma factor FlgM [Gammaproteobacteria bacterium]